MYDGSWTTAAGQARSAGEAVNHGQADLYDAAQVGAGNVEAGRARTKPAESDAKAFLAEVTCGGTAWRSGAAPTGAPRRPSAATPSIAL